MNDEAAIFANNLKRIMEHYGHNQRDLERKSGVAQKTISNYLNCTAKNGPNFGHICKIAAAYKIKTWHLLLDNCPDDLLLSPFIEKLFENIANNDKKGREITMNVSEARAHYSYEQKSKISNK